MTPGLPLWIEGPVILLPFKFLARVLHHRHDALKTRLPIRDDRPWPCKAEVTLSFFSRSQQSLENHAIFIPSVSGLRARVIAETEPDKPMINMKQGAGAGAGAAAFSPRPPSV